MLRNFGKQFKLAGLPLELLESMLEKYLVTHCPLAKGFTTQPGPSVMEKLQKCTKHAPPAQPVWHMLNTLHMFTE
jgi:hypothetical protein